MRVKSERKRIRSDFGAGEYMWLSGGAKGCVKAGQQSTAMSERAIGELEREIFMMRILGPAWKGLQSSKFPGSRKTNRCG